MDAKLAKTLDEAALNTKRKHATRCVADDSNDKMDSENTVVAIKQEPYVNLDAYTEYAYGNLDVDSVQRIFLTAMAFLGITEPDIVEVYRNSGKSMQMRLDLFKMQVDITKELKGDANVRYAWFACSKEELSTMMKHGLTHYGLSPPKCLYGFGVHLAALTHPYACSLFCDVDKNGTKYLVLCRVIMGNMELLHPNSDQNRPSGYEYDNGVDNIQCPKYYVVWNMNMNTHIYPEFVVSFKSPLEVVGSVCSSERKKNGYGNSAMDTGKDACAHANTQRTSRSRGIPFPTLLTTISNMVPPNIMYQINDHYAQLMSKKISREEFEGKLRLIVGDNIIISALTIIPFKGKDFSASSNIQRIPTSPWTSFRTLLDAIRNMVPSNSMDQIIGHYEQLLSKKISRDEFVRKLRFIVGDNIIKAAITNTHFKGSSSLGGSNRSNIKQE